MKDLKNNSISLHENIFHALKIMKLNSSKCLVVIDKNLKFIGTLSDGDIRRAILKNISLDNKVQKIYNKKSFFLFESKLKKSNIIEIFKNNKYEIIPIIDKDKNLLDIIHWSESIFDKSSKKISYKIDNQKIELFIMAGGKGIRLKPITNFLPKSLLPINGEPILSLIIKKFSVLGIRDVSVSLNAKDKITKNYIKTNFNKNIRIYSESKELGTIGSLSLFKKNKKTTNTIIISNCDTLVTYDLNKVLKKHFDRDSDMTIIAVKDQYSIPYGVLQANNKNYLTGIIEKPNYDYIFSSGVYILNIKLLKLIKKNQNLDFNEFISKVLFNKYKINIYNIPKDKWVDIGNFTELNKLLN